MLPTVLSFLDLRTFWQSKSPTCVGVYFDDASVCVVALDEYRDRYHLQHLSRQALPLGVIEHGKIVDKNKLAAAVTKTLASAGIVTQQVVGCISSDFVMTQVIELAAELEDDDIEAHILLEAENYISQSLDDVAFDFVVLDRQSDISKILLVVARQSAIDDCVETLALAGLQAVAIDTHDQALLRAYRLFDYQNYVAVVDFGYTQSKIYIAHHGEFIQSQAQLFGRADFSTGFATTHETESKIDLSKKPAFDYFDKAEITRNFENPKQSNILTKSDDCLEDDFAIEFIQDQPQIETWQTEQQIYPSAILGDAHHAIVEQICQFILTYQASWKCQFDAILIHGLGEYTQVVIQELSKKLPILTAPFDPFLVMSGSEVAQNQNANQYGVACGLALNLSSDHRVNLLPWRDELRFIQNQKFKQLLWAVVIGSIIILGSLIAWVYQGIRQQEAINAEIGVRIESQMQKIQHLKQQQHQMQQRQKQLDALINIKKENERLLDKWQNLSVNVPQGVYLNSLNENQDTLNLTGVANDVQQISVFSDSLQLSGFYDEVMMTKLQKLSDLPHLYEFALTATATNLNAGDTSDEQPPSIVPIKQEDR